MKFTRRDLVRGAGAAALLPLFPRAGIAGDWAAVEAEARGQTIVMLVDEPGADLDRANLARLLQEVAAAPAQAFVTSLDPASVGLPAGARAFHVEHGEVQALL